MVQVPSYGGPQVQSTATQTPRRSDRVTADQLGGGIAKAGAELANTANTIYAAEMERAREVRLMGARNDYMERLTPHLADWEKRTGLNAQTSIDEFRATHDELVGEIGGGMDERGMRAFREWTDQRAMETGRRLTFRAAGEMKRYEQQQFEASGELLKQRARQSSMDPVALAGTLDDRIVEIEQFADANGMPAEWTQARVDQERSAAIRVVIEQHLTDGQEIIAKEWYDTNKENMLPQDANAMGKAVEAASNMGEAYRIADEVFEQVEAGEIDQREARRRIRQLSGENARVRGAADQRFDYLHRDMQTAVAESRSDMVTAAHSFIIENDGNMSGMDTGLQARLIAEDPKAWDFLERAARSRAAGEMIRTDRATWANFIGDVIDRPEIVANMTEADMLENYSLTMSDGDFKQALNMWGTIRTESRNSESARQVQAMAQGFRTERQIVESALGRIGIDIDNPNEREEGLLRAMDLAIATRKETLGVKQLPPDELTKVVDGVISTSMGPGSRVFYKAWLGRGRDRPVEGLGEVVQNTRQIPALDLNWIIQAFRARQDREPSQQELVEAHNSHKARERNPAGASAIDPSIYGGAGGGR